MSDKKLVLGSDDMGARLTAEIAAENQWLAEYEVRLNNRRIEEQRATPNIVTMKNEGTGTVEALEEAKKVEQFEFDRHKQRLDKLLSIKQSLENKSQGNPWFKKQPPEGYRK